jgi:hypothetical protein
MSDGLVETAGLPSDEELDELEEELASEDDGIVPEDYTEPLEVPEETPVFENDPPADDTVQALEAMTIPELKDLADARGLDYKSDIHKGDLVELLASS